jgi:hypothetical protein
MIKAGAKIIMDIMVQMHPFLQDVAIMIFMEDIIIWIIEKEQKEYSGLRVAYPLTMLFKSDSKLLNITTNLHLFLEEFSMVNNSWTKMTFTTKIPWDPIIFAPPSVQ